MVRFNPCCAGCSSGSITVNVYLRKNGGFNPCCAGCSSGSLYRKKPHTLNFFVSILVVLDVVLEGGRHYRILSRTRVSILVVLDVVLEVSLFSFLLLFIRWFQSLLCWM